MLHRSAVGIDELENQRANVVPPGFAGKYPVVPGIGFDVTRLLAVRQSGQQVQSGDALTGGRDVVLAALDGFYGDGRDFAEIESLTEVSREERNALRDLFE